MRRLAHDYGHLLVRFRAAIQMTLDTMSWAIAIAAALLLRLDFDIAQVPWRRGVLAWAFVVVLQCTLGPMQGLYRHRWRYATFEEVATFTRTTGLIGCFLTIASWVAGSAFPISTGLIAAPTALLIGGLARLTWRRFREGGFASEEAVPVVIFGAGAGGTQIIRALNDPTSPFHPVALLDDDPSLLGLRIRQLPVRGGRDQIATVCQQLNARRLILAIPSAGAELIREIRAICEAIEVEILVLPPVGALFGAQVSLSDIYRPTALDLLGRRQVDTNIHEVAGYIRDKTVLVTGAGGSIGSELVRQLTRFEPARIVMLDRDESALQQLEISMSGRGLLQDPNLVVACIRDLDRMNEVFADFRPEVVFHAAALKHLPLLEMHPTEAWKTNVVGTANVLQAAATVGVRHFVNISTDKAAAPTSILGHSKAMAEGITASFGTHHPGSFISVRFGNVLESRGSVIPLFNAQIAQGGPVTVTHPDATRYFMTIPEACQLVIQAGAIGTSRQALVLDMGAPVRIVDVAKRLIRASGKHVEIVFTGLRPGEKLHEDLASRTEKLEPTSHPLISSVPVPVVANYSFAAFTDRTVIDLTSPPLLAS